ncbi:toprim domain-containing protein [Paenibacillus agricola]|uniref:DNA primase n=1 Tax=Paenibacillus agricola TaxID=2716264 RepID=A0ABX0J8M3_9BACL|nr:toprim domain-containing protein [Paenibacillus agricola]NHN31183.1 DNA primase [Paenibacillus agricola]
MSITLYIRGPNGSNAPSAEPTEVLVEVDIIAELERFTWTKPTWLPDRLIAVSPFRHGDRQPSFYVYTEDTASAKAGDWGDPGAEDSEWARGGFVKLIAFLDNVTPTEVIERFLAEYPNDLYGQNPDEPPSLKPLKLSSADKPTPVTLGMRLLDEYRFRSPYLGSRGISESVQRLMSIGYDKRRSAVTIPWVNADNSLANVKYRRIDTKVFWYMRGGRPIRDLVYGINIAYERRLTKAAVVESEIDAMTLMSAGIFAIATGGTSFTEAKRDLIIRSRIEEVTVIRDNDGAGRKWQRKVISELSPFVRVKVATVPSRYKDVNEMGTSAKVKFPSFVERARTVYTVKIALV